jgi:hypothetical protein
VELNDIRRNKVAERFGLAVTVTDFSIRKTA